MKGLKRKLIMVPTATQLNDSYYGSAGSMNLWSKKDLQFEFPSQN